MMYWRTHAALHLLWTKAVGQEGYVKEEWMELEASILEIMRKASRMTGRIDDEHRKE